MLFQKFINLAFPDSKLRRRFAQESFMKVGSKIEVNIIAIAHNLKKIWKMKGERGEVFRKCVVKENFVLIFVEINFIVGQPPLLYSFYEVKIDF
ncbi:MAG: hypothetical protein U9Q06_02390 [Nanoarchaeota archaeon]|nr:hypothetical protein [Nanoarchaeota archaeon]